MGYRWRQLARLTAVLVFAVAGLAGCNKVAGPAASSSKAVSSQSKTKPAVATTRTNNLHWTSKNAALLHTTMTNFGTTMQQNYVKVTRSSATQWYSTDLSQYIKAHHKIVVSGETKAVKWLPKEDEGSNKKMNVVAVYADPTQHILYLFTDPNGDAQVLVSQEDVDANGRLNFKPTANSDLTAAYAAVIAGRADAKFSAGTSGSPASSNANAVYPANMQGTWYTASNDGKIAVLKFTASSRTYNGQVSYAHEDSLHTAAENKARNGEGKPNVARANWETYSHFTADGHSWVNLRGWYQSAGDGVYYTVINRSIDGSMQPVLTEAGGAEIWTDAHYYRSRATASKMTTQMFSDDRVNP